MLSENSAKVYKFDLDALAPLADLYGPTIDEAATPLTVMPESQSRAFQHD